MDAKYNYGVKQNYCPTNSEYLISNRKEYIISALLGCGSWPQGSYEIGSVHLSVVSETWDGPYY